MNDTTLPLKQKQKIKRDKIRLRKGFALHDWKRLLLSAKDLAQRKGQPYRTIQMSEIQLHDKVHDGWIALHGKVYNIGPYLHYHPGGVEIFEQCLGGDASALFDEYHRWVNIDSLIGPLLLGYLVPESSNIEDLDSNNAKNNILPPALTKTANGTTAVSALSMPPPRPVNVNYRQQQFPSLLSSGSKKDEDDDVEMEDLNPWEK